MNSRENLKVLRLFNDAVSSSEVVLRRVIWEDDHVHVW